jgi:tRNA(fMet)-specific endonuclease VapC
MPSYMLDTNMIGHLMKKHPVVRKRLAAVPVGDVCVSAITAGELRYGLAKRPSARRTKAVQELLARINVLPWTNEVTKRYGSLRAKLEASGKVLAPLDMQIAAHAVSDNCILVTADMAFSQVKQLSVVDWTV